MKLYLHGQRWRQFSVEQNSNPMNGNKARFLWNPLLRVRRSTDIIRQDPVTTAYETGDFNFNTHGVYVYNWKLAMHFRNGATFQSFGRDRCPPTLQFRAHVWVDRSLSGARCKGANCGVTGGGGEELQICQRSWNAGQGARGHHLEETVTCISIERD